MFSLLFSFIFDLEEVVGPMFCLKLYFAKVWQFLILKRTPVRLFLKLINETQKWQLYIMDEGGVGDGGWIFQMFLVGSVVEGSILGFHFFLVMAQFVKQVSTVYLAKFDLNITKPIANFSWYTYYMYTRAASH